MPTEREQHIARVIADEIAAQGIETSRAENGPIILIGPWPAIDLMKISTAIHEALPDRRKTRREKRPSKRDAS